MTPAQEKMILAKLRSPLHVNFISRLLKCNEEEAQLEINNLIDRDLIVEYNPKIAKGYYVIKNL
jgi:hypothetical protein